MYPPPRLHQQTGVGDTEAHVTGPLGQHTQAWRQWWVDHNHLTMKTKKFISHSKFEMLSAPVHHTAANQSEPKEGWTGIFEHLELPVVDNKEDGDKTGDGTEERHTEQHKSESEIMLMCLWNIHF